MTAHRCGYTHIYTYICIYVYTYIQRERERREIKRLIGRHTTNSGIINYSSICVLLLSLFMCIHTDRGRERERERDRQAERERERGGESATV